MMSDYFTDFYVQEYKERSTGFPPPSDVEWVYEDGEPLKGVFILEQSKEMMTASAQGVKTRGRFVTLTDASLKGGEVVRRASDGMYIKIIGDPKTAPEQAENQIKSFIGEVTDRQEMRRQTI